MKLTTLLGYMKPGGTKNTAFAQRMRKRREEKRAAYEEKKTALADSWAAMRKAPEDADAKRVRAEREQKRRRDGAISAVAWTHDGVSVRDGFVTIHQRHKRGDVAIPIASITGVTSTSLDGVAGLGRNRKLQITVGGKRYVVRNLPPEEQRAAVSAIKAAMATKG